MKKRSDIFLCAVCIVLSVSIGLVTLLKPQSEFSQRENRVLAEFPRLSFKSLADGEFSYRLGRFLEDQFPLREYFTTLRSLSELSLGRGENNGVIYGKDGYLMIRPSYEDLSLFEENLGAVETFYSDMSAAGIDTEVFFAPRGIDVLGEYLPYAYPSECEETVWKILRERLPYVISANEEIALAISSGEYAWYKTDHHWTPLGAYEAYKKIIAAFGDTPLCRSEFEIRTLCSDFYGSVASRCGSVLTSSDELFVVDMVSGGEIVVVNYDLGEAGNSLYFEEHLDAKDKYKVFMGGNFGHIGVYDNSKEPRETLVLIKDSFANCIIPFLSEHYDLEIYDLRYFEGDIREEIASVLPEKILILYGIDTAASDASLGDIAG